MEGRPTAVSIGSFDGVHRGHAELARVARESVGRDGRWVVLAFDPHPRETLRPGTAPPRLTTFSDRAALLKASGADEVLRLDPDRGLLSLSAEQFIGHVARSFSPRVIVEGDDFRFGASRSGGRDELDRLAAHHGFESVCVDEVDVELTDQSVVRASSTMTRWLIARGRMEDAARVLGRPYELAGTVERGEQLGRTIGVPTANLSIETMPPARGVYAAIAMLPGGGALPAAVNVGGRPTVSGVGLRVEAHFLDMPSSLDGQSTDTDALAGLPEYGWRCGLRLVSWVRDEMKFGSLGELTEQIARDIARVREDARRSTPEGRCS